MVIPRFVRQALAGEPITVYDDGEQTRCFCNVRDVVAAVLLLVEHPEAEGQVFNIGSKEEISMSALAERVKGAHRIHLQNPGGPLRASLRGRIRRHAPAGAGYPKDPARRRDGRRTSRSRKPSTRSSPISATGRRLKQEAWRPLPSIPRSGLTLSERQALLFVGGSAVRAARGGGPLGSCGWSWIGP